MIFEGQIRSQMTQSLPQQGVIEVRDLHWAIVAAQYRSLRQAAESLSIKQSTLSRRLLALEHRLGAVLFERTNGGTRPTVEGQEFIESAKQILEYTQSISERLKNRSRGEVGRLTIGVHVSLSAGNFRATLMDFHRRFPEVETRLIDGTGDRLIADLASSMIDIAFILERSSRWDGNSLSVWNERVVVALPEDHPLATHDVVRWEDLRQQPLLLPQRGPGPDFLKLVISKLGQDPCCLLRHDVALDRFLTLVGVGWGILLALEGATGGVYPGVTFREVHDIEGATRLNFRVYWRPMNANPSLQAFLSMLRERYPNVPSNRPFA